MSDESREFHQYRQDIYAAESFHAGRSAPVDWKDDGLDPIPDLRLCSYCAAPHQSEKCPECGSTDSEAA